MNDYVTLDTKKYKTSALAWEPLPVVPATLRIALSGDTDTVFGPVALMRWEGEMLAKVTPESGYGSILDLRLSLKKLQSLAFIDHYGASYTVLAQQVGERSVTPMWDGALNEFHVGVVLMGK